MKKMRDILYEKVNNYPKVEISLNTSLQDLEKLGEGTFIIDKFPSIELIKQFPTIFDCEGEVGLDYIEGILILTLSKKGYIELSTDFSGYIRNGDAQFTLHSHPAGAYGRYPSLDDIKFYKGGIFYIFTDIGMLEVDTTQFDRTKNIEKELEDFMNGEGIYEDPESLYYYFYKSINIKWKRYIVEEDIKQVINQSISRKIEFWDKEVGITPYPGKRK